MSMASHSGHTPRDYAGAGATAHGPAYQAYQCLRFAFIVAPILAGIDKFFHVLVDWDMYLAPFFGQRILHGHGHTFMLVAGVVEVIAGLGVALLPRYFGYVVMAWLWCICINLLMPPHWYDIALRDFGLSLGALALARLAVIYSHHHATPMPTEARP